MHVLALMSSPPSVTKATGAASLTVGGHKTGYVTWQSAPGHKATGTASLTVGGHTVRPTSCASMAGGGAS